MAQELVWARVGDTNTAVSRAYADKHGLKVLDESVYDHNGDVRAPERVDTKPADARKASEKKAAEVIASTPATSTSEENSR